MKKKFLCVFFSVLITVFSALRFHESVHALSVSATAAILYCPDNQEIIYENNIHQRRAIASITKIMTAVIALEQCSVSNIDVRITPAMYAEGSSMYLKEGEILKLSELVKGMMAVSGNDAANAVAIAVGKTKEQFADLMNRKAQKLGMKDTHFVTPSGLDDEEHYSSAYDMALLCAYAMKIDAFQNIVSQKNIQVSYIYPENKTQMLANHNKLLSLCEGCIGIKTGFTKKAGRTLTSCAERNGIRLIAVTLNDGNDWEDHCALYDYGFSLLEKIQLGEASDRVKIPVVGSELQEVEITPEYLIEAVILKEEKNKITKEIYAPRFLYAPVSESQKAGTISYFINSRKIGEIPLISEQQAFYYHD